MPGRCSASCAGSREAAHPIFGSSANLTGTGPKFRVNDIQPAIRVIADLTIDYGIRKYHTDNQSATILQVPEVEVIRIGSCYELMADVLRRDFRLIRAGKTTGPGTCRNSRYRS